MLNKDGNIRIYPKKKKGSSQRGSGNKVPSRLNESPFANSIPDSTEKSNPSDENSSKRSPESGKRASMDSDYMSALERGDMVTAQRMVDEAAREAGYTYKGYHGTRSGGFTVFKNRLPGMVEGLKSIFLAKDEGTAGQYAYGNNRKIYRLYAKMDNPLIVYGIC